MPVIIVGADTAIGDAIVDAVAPNAGEVRVFISDSTRAVSLKQRGVKVAVGDVSDASHVEAAVAGSFCAVLVVEAATDDRQRSFGSARSQVLEGWAMAMRGSKVRRVIWVAAPTEVEGLPGSVAEVATVTIDGDIDQAAGAVAALEEADQLLL